MHTYIRTYTQGTALLRSTFGNIRSTGSGREAGVVETQIERASIHFTLPYSVQTDLHKFCTLEATWKEETKHISSITQIALNPAYQQIIGMGPSVIPFILESLRLEAHHWFWALKAITGIDPIPPEERGNIQKMRDAWLQWGRENGYII